MRCNSMNEMDTMVCDTSLRKGTPKSFLTREEEVRLGVLALAGDVSARNQLVEATIGLAYSVARRSSFRQPGLELEDLQQEALLALVQCAERFDPVSHPNCKFSTFAGFAMVMWLRSYCARHLRRPRELTNFDLSEIPDPSTLLPSIAVRDAEIVWDGVERLNAADRQLVELYYGLGDSESLTLSEIGERFGITKQRVHQKVARTLERLSERLHKAA
jgi:RNA polymerase sigma factor (sigma-70 family)